MSLITDSVSGFPLLRSSGARPNMKTSKSHEDINLIYEAFITRIIIQIRSDFQARIMSLATLRVMLSPCWSFIDSTCNTSGPGNIAADARPSDQIVSAGHLPSASLYDSQGKQIISQKMIDCIGVTFRENTVINLSATVCMREITITTTANSHSSSPYPSRLPQSCAAVLNLQASAEFLRRLNSPPLHLSVSLGNK